MHDPVKTPSDAPLRTGGCRVDVFYCAYELVDAWGKPTLRNPFWRCYLPVSDGASVRALARSWPMHRDEILIIPADSPVCGHCTQPFSLYYAHFNCSIRLVEALPSTLPVQWRIRTALDEALA